MNAYLFTAGVTRSQFRAGVGSRSISNSLRTWSACDSLIVCADTAEAAQARFEDWLHAKSQTGGTVQTPVDEKPSEPQPPEQPEDENSVETRINEIKAAQFFDQQLTETAPVPLDWPQIVQQANADVESSPLDDFEQGYWVDVNAVVSASPDLEALRRDLPEDVRSGLNWSEDRQFFFVLSVLSPPPPPPPEPDYDSEAAAASSAETPEDPTFGLAEQPGDFPELADKEMAVLIRARNSAVATWLWRKQSAGTTLAGNQIRIDPWCGAVKVETADEQSA